MNIIKGLLIIFLYLLSLPVTYARGGKNDYELIWEEDFKGKSINTGKWSKITRGKPDWRKYMSDNEILYEVKKVNSYFTELKTKESHQTTLLDF